MHQSFVGLLGRLIISMGVVLAVMWLAARVLRNRNIGGFGGGRKARSSASIEVLARQAFGKNAPAAPNPTPAAATAPAAPAVSQVTPPATPTAPTAPTAPGATGTQSINVSLPGKPSDSVTIIIALTLLGVAPALLMMMTSFTRI